VLEEMNEWAARPLDETYAVILVDAIVVKVCVTGRSPIGPSNAAIGVTPTRGTRHPRSVGRHRW
jgi:putative transposase